MLRKSLYRNLEYSDELAQLRSSIGKRIAQIMFQSNINIEKLSSNHYIDLGFFTPNSAKFYISRKRQGHRFNAHTALEDGYEFTPRETAHLSSLLYILEIQDTDQIIHQIKQQVPQFQYPPQKDL